MPKSEDVIVRMYLEETKSTKDHYSNTYVISVILSGTVHAGDRERAEEAIQDQLHSVDVLVSDSLEGELCKFFKNKLESETARYEEIVSQLKKTVEDLQSQIRAPNTVTKW